MCISYNWEIDVYRFSFYRILSNLTITGNGRTVCEIRNF